MKTIVVTRHAALVDYLVRSKICPPNPDVREHVTENDVRGAHVIGVLPLHLAALAERVTVVPLHLTPEMRGQELDLATVTRIAGDPQTYVVRNWPVE